MKILKRGVVSAMNNKNADLKNAMLQARVRQWEVALEFGISESNFIRKLRKELPEAEKKKIFDIIEKLKS